LLEFLRNPVWDDISLFGQYFSNICFHPDKNIQAILLSTALELSSPPLLWKTSGLVRATHRINHLLPGCAGDLPSIAITAVTDGATQLPSHDRASCRDN